MKNSNNSEIRGIYGLIYGYSDHELKFIATRGEVEKSEGIEISLETSQHCYEEVELNDIFLITEDADFIEKFEQLNLSTISPLDYIDEEE